MVRFPQLRRALSRSRYDRFTSIRDVASNVWNAQIVVKNPSADESGSAGARGTLQVYNLGGEGEVPGATDVNALKGNRLSEEQIRARNPTGEFVREDIGAFLEKAETGSAEKIVANKIPSMALGKDPTSIAENMKRVLAPGGRASFTQSSPLGPHVKQAFEAAGFICNNFGCSYIKK